MKKFALLGYPLGHSFSQKYFTQKFIELDLPEHQYELWEMPEIASLKKRIDNEPDLCGFNVTIPYKQEIIPLLDEISDEAQAIGAVNVVKRLPDGRLQGHNSDYHGFLHSLLGLIGDARPHALVLGHGGAARAVTHALRTLGISYLNVVRKSPGEGQILYSALGESLLSTHLLIINTTPLGTSPATEARPDIPYHLLTPQHFLHDLVYNPETTRFMELGAQRGVQVKNGLEMLHLQAEKAWEIWNS